MNEYSLMGIIMALFGIDNFNYNFKYSWQTYGRLDWRIPRLCGFKVLQIGDICTSCKFVKYTQGLTL